MAAFCWMLVEGIYLYLFVVKVYNINTKMHMYHVISWGIYNYLLPYLVYYSPTYTSFFVFPICRSSCRHGSHFIEHCCWKRRNEKLYQWYIVRKTFHVLLFPLYFSYGGDFSFIFFSLVSSCWLSSTNKPIWIFVTFVAFIESVSLWLIDVIWLFLFIFSNWISCFSLSKTIVCVFFSKS